MAPTKFGLFKARSRDQPEQPSTENLLKSSSSDYATTPGSPIPSTSRGLVEDLTPEDITDLQIDSDDDENSEQTSQARRGSQMSVNLINYHPLKNPPSTDITTSSTLQDDKNCDDIDSNFDVDDASTSADCNSIQMDASSVAPSEDISVYCGNLKRKKNRSRGDEQLIRDLGMWHASNIEVMQNLLSRSGTIDEQIKWEAIATARGLCTLTDNCSCPDCKKTKYLVSLEDGDGGMGAAFNAINMGCSLQ